MHAFRRNAARGAVVTGKVDVVVTGGPLLPEPLESRRIARSVFDSVLDIAVSEIVLEKPGIGALVSQRKAAGVATMS